MNNTYTSIRAEIEAAGAQLVAVSKTKPIEAIQDLYAQGQRVFGENKVQELVDKQAQLPADIQWHMIGHLQRNKVKYIAPFVHLIHAVDSERLLREIDKQAAKHDRVISVLLQIHIAQESTKFGFSTDELDDIIASGVLEELQHVRAVGLMAMASNVPDETQVRQEFKEVREVFELQISKSSYCKSNFKVLSMGMSGDYPLALSEGATHVRIGSLLFGARN